MTALVLELKVAPDAALDMSPLVPQGLRAKSGDQIRKMRLSLGARRVAVGDLFELTGDPGDALCIKRVTATCHRVGYGMAAGTLVIEGCGGDEIGREMHGGEIRVRGDAGDGIGAGMTGGVIDVSGNAGDCVGGLAPGSIKGMSEGVIIVGGDAGDRVGERMRRGTIVVAGAAGAHIGDRMIAGTVVVLGESGMDVGLGMRRGTILLAMEPEHIARTFNECGTFELAFMAILRDFVTQLKPSLKQEMARFSRVRRWSGDLAYGGKGEILVAENR